nr:MAG: hypothetical protein [Bacteriophage sp.]
MIAYLVAFDISGAVFPSIGIMPNAPYGLPSDSSFAPFNAKYTSAAGYVSGLNARAVIPPSIASAASPCQVF